MQAGINKIELYENNGLAIDLLAHTISGQTPIVLDTFPQLTIEPMNVNINYTISAQINDLLSPYVSQINNSIYGWIAVFYFNDLTTKIIERPFFNLSNSGINSNTSHSRTITLNSWNRQGLIVFG